MSIGKLPAHAALSLRSPQAEGQPCPTGSARMLFPCRHRPFQSLAASGVPPLPPTEKSRPYHVPRIAVLGNYRHAVNWFYPVRPSIAEIQTCPMTTDHSWPASASIESTLLPWL